MCQEGVESALFIGLETDALSFAKYLLMPTGRKSRRLGVSLGGRNGATLSSVHPLASLPAARAPLQEEAGVGYGQERPGPGCADAHGVPFPVLWRADQARPVYGGRLDPIRHPDKAVCSPKGRL